jgi:hypothetical protein
MPYCVPPSAVLPGKAVVSVLFAAKAVEIAGSRYASI